jgi:hypothetical protein
MPKTKLLAIVFLLGLGFSACQENHKKPTEVKNTAVVIDSSAYMEKGMEAIGATFGALSQALMQQMTERGALAAVEYCNIAALPLTDSLAQLHNLEIKRTSLKLRNPKNAPLDWETAVLKRYEKMLTEGEVPKPELQKLGHNQWVLTAPIRLQEPCLKCHGKEIDEQLAQKLDQFYPKDQARNYEAGDLRGIWSITFKK